MSRRAIALVIVFFTVLIIANIAVIAIWLPRHKNAANPPTPVTPTGGSSAATSAVAPGNSSSSAVSSLATAGNGSAAGFAVQRQVPSPSGNLVIKYLRDKATKTRQIAVQDAHQPNQSAVLFETKNSAWALISPDDQWIVVEEKKGNGEGNVQLFHRAGGTSLQFTRVQEPGAGGLQDTVWNAYASATQADPGSRRGASIDATAWADDSRKLNLSVAYMPGPNNPDVPAPWSCTYDVASKQVTPVSALATRGDEGDQQADAGEDSTVASSEQTGSDPFSASGTDTPAEEEVADELPGEKFPATRLDELSVPDVNESSVEDINYAMNEMYARHGAEFTDKKVGDQFAEFSWYKPRPGLSLANAEAEFTDLEKANMKVLRTCRDSKVAAAKRKSAPARKQHVQEEGAGEKALRAFRLWQDAGAPAPQHP